MKQFQAPLFSKFFINPTIKLDENLQQSEIFCKTLLGELFVTGYRVFKPIAELETTIMLKRQQATTLYLYLKIIQSKDNSNYQQDFHSISSAVTQIDQMRQLEQDDFVIYLCFCQQKSVQILTKHLFLKAKADKTILREIESYCYIPPKNEQELFHEGKQDFGNLKEVIYTYIDTFGARYKTNFYQELQKISTSSYQINLLINTINFIIYSEAAGGGYNQIESANWTCFEMRSKEKLSSDRKDIVLTGGSKILMINLILLDDIKAYRAKYQNQAREVLMECRKSYTQAIIKLYQITNALHTSKLIYKVSCELITSFASEK